MRIFVKTVLLGILLIGTFSVKIHPQTWSFDTSLENWQIVNENGEAELAEFDHFSGVRLRMNEFGDLIEFANSDLPQSFRRDTVRFAMRIPPDIRNIEAVELFAVYQDTSNQDSMEVINRYNNVESRSTFILHIPDNDSLISLGLRVIGKTTIGSADFELDYVTFERDRLPRWPFSDIEPVRDLFLDSVGTGFVAISWPEVGDTSLSHYQIIRDNLNTGLGFERTKTDITSSTFFIDHTVFSGTEYQYRVRSIDKQGLSNSYCCPAVYATTLAFPSDTTWDFEQSLDGWEAKKGNARISDSVSYSAFHSIELSFSASSDTILFTSNEFQPKPNQDVLYSLKLPESFAGLEKLGAYVVFNGGTDTLFSPIDLLTVEEGSWIKESLRVPDYQSFQEYGIMGISTDQFESEIYLDLVTTDPNERGELTINTPTELQVLSKSFSGANIDWKKPEGNGPVLYSIYYSINPWIGRNAQTLDSQFSIIDLPYGSNINFTLSAQDQFGRTTENQNISIDLPTPTSNVWYDFEEGLEGWLINEGLFDVVDSISYSGLQSVQIHTNKVETSFFIQKNDTISLVDILPGHHLKYHLLISSEDIKELGAFRFWVKDEQEEILDSVISIKTIIPDDWTEYNFSIPESIKTVQSVGVSFLAREEAMTLNTTIYVDNIQSNNPPDRQPKLTVPDNLKDISSLFTVRISWNKSTGRDEVSEYNIYRRSVNNPESIFNKHVSTSDTVFSEFFPGSVEFEYAISVSNTNGLESMLSNPIIVKTGQTNSEENRLIPKEFELLQNYPNPFNPSTLIRYKLPTQLKVKLEIFDIVGRKVAVLVNTNQVAGIYEVKFDASHIASGMYIYRIEAGTFVQTKQMMIIK